MNLQDCTRLILKSFDATAACIFVPVTLESIKSYHVPPLLEGTDDEPDDILFMSVTPESWADLAACLRILPHSPLLKGPQSLLWAAGLKPYLGGR